MKMIALLENEDAMPKRKWRCHSYRKMKMLCPIENEDAIPNRKWRCYPYLKTPVPTMQLWILALFYVRKVSIWHSLWSGIKEVVLYLNEKSIHFFLTANEVDHNFCAWTRKIIMFAELRWWRRAHRSQDTSLATLHSLLDEMIESWASCHKSWNSVYVAGDTNYSLILTGEVNVLLIS